MQSDDPDSVDPKVSGESPSGEEFHPRSVVEPNGGVTSDAKPKEDNLVSHDLAENQPSTTDEEPLPGTPTNVRSADDVNVLSLAVIPAHFEAPAVGEAMKTWLTRLGFVRVKTRREAEARPEEKVDAAGQDDFGLKNDEPLTLDGNHDGAVIRSKLQLTKTADGTQTLSYEEEMVKPEGERAVPRCGMRTPGQRRKLHSTFLNFLRCFFLVFSQLS